MADAAWYVGIGGEQKGPFPDDEVKAMILGRELTARNYVWKEGMESWLPVGEVEEFAETLKEAPPPPAKAIPGAAFIKGFWGDLAAIVRDPDEGLDAVVDKKPMCFSLTWMVLGIIVFALLSLHQDRAPMLALAYVPAGSLGAAFGKALFLGVIAYAIWFGALMVTVGPVLKSQADWKDGLTILGLSTIPTASIGLLMWLLLYVRSWLFTMFVLVVLVAVALPLNVLIFYRALARTTKASGRSVMFAVPAIYLAANVIYGLLVLFMRIR